MAGPELSFAGLLRQLRAEARLTREELAEAASLSPQAVGALERGVHRTAHKRGHRRPAGRCAGLPERVCLLFVAAGRGRAWLEVERANLHAAAEYAADRPQLPHAIAIPAAMGGFLAAHGYWEESADRAVRLFPSGPVTEVAAVSVSAGTRAAIA